MKKTFEIPDKWAFNRDAETLAQTVGMADERINEIINAMRHAMIDSSNQGELLEKTLNYSKPQSLIDVVIAAFCAGVMHGKKDNPLQRFLQSLKSEK